MLTGPSISRRLLLAALPLLALGLATSATAAESPPSQPPLLRQFCNTGSGAGQCVIPRGIAVDQTSGDVYVADGANKRVEKFTAWGDFLRAWGRDVVSEGPDDTGSGFEVCVPAQGDTCKAGEVGAEAGEFGTFGPEGLAIDSQGDLFVVDWSLVEGSGHRVQKFSPTGEFLLTFGGEVNRTKVEQLGSTEAQRNLCPVDPGDVCRAGTRGTGNGQFEFGESGGFPGSYIAVDTKNTATAADDVVYVGDQGRVQQFDTEGHYLADLPDPDQVLEAEGTVSSLAVDPTSGSLYLGFFDKPNVHKLSPAGAAQCTIEAHKPTAIAVGPAGETYVVDGEVSGGVGVGVPREISSFDSNCGARQLLFPKEDGGTKGNQFSSDPTGIAVSAACGIAGVDLLISNPHQENSFVKLFGSPPQDLDPPCSEPEHLPPSIEASYATSVAATGASVGAEIDPHFWPDTTYSVQYATAACISSEGWSGPCVSSQPQAPQLLTESVASGTLQTKNVFLGAGEALAPDTDYRFRFLAQSSGSDGATVTGPEAAFHTYPLQPPAKSDCANQPFRSAASAHLADCRAYEVVSPLEKGGGEPLPPREVPNAVQQSAPSGDALTFASTTAFGADLEAGAFFNQYISRRDPDSGWLTASINAPRTGRGLVSHEEINNRYKLFSPDLCSGWLVQDTDVPLVAGPVPTHVANLYRRSGLLPGCQGSGYQLLSTIQPPGFPDGEEAVGASEYFPTIQGFSDDGLTSVFRASAVLSPGACQQTTPAGANGKGLYQLYLSRGGTPGVPPTLVSVLPNGEAPCTHSSLGTAQGPGEDSVYHALSEDGSRAYWTETDQAEDSGTTYEAGLRPGRLYVRVNATQPQSTFNGAGKCNQSSKACTLNVSREAETASEGNASRFLSAAADGSHAVFLTGTLVEHSLAAEDLYEFDLAQALVGKPADSLIAPKVKGILGSSDDASTVYLVSSANLAPGGEAGKASLYLYQRGTGLRFIAKLSSSANLTEPDSGIVSSFPENHTARVTPDGLHAAFTSADPALAQSVAGFDNTDASSGRPDRELYLYDAEANAGQGKLVCVSCNPSGARPSGRETTPGNNGKPGIWSAARIPGWVSETDPGHALSDDGQRLFFESFEALLPRDSNGRADVYEWEAASDKADCLGVIGGELYEPSSGGCLSLISSGQGPADAELIDASADGRDVFFLTNASLLPQDLTAADIYDARSGGGFPAPTPPPPACEGEACQSVPAPPNDPTPASATYQGAGNVVEAPAKHKKHKKKHRHHRHHAKRGRGGS